jgi:hypothetical protein
MAVMLVQGIVMNVIKEKRGGKIRAGRRCNNETRREEKKRVSTYVDTHTFVYEKVCNKC